MYCCCGTIAKSWEIGLAFYDVGSLKVVGTA